MPRADPRMLEVTTKPRAVMKNSNKKVVACDLVLRLVVKLHRTVQSTAKLHQGGGKLETHLPISEAAGNCLMRPQTVGHTQM